MQSSPKAERPAHSLCQTTLFKNQVKIEMVTNDFKHKILTVKRTKPVKEQDELRQYQASIKRIITNFKNSFAKFGIPPKTCSNFYRIGRTLGRGTFGKVSIGVHKLTQQLVAIKSVKKNEEIQRGTLEEMSLIKMI